MKRSILVASLIVLTVGDMAMAQQPASGPSLEETMSFILSHLKDVHREFTIRQDNGVSSITEGVSKASASAKCTISISRHELNDYTNELYSSARQTTDHYSSLTETDTSDEIPLGKLATATVRFDQSLNPHPGQLISPAPQDNVLILAASTDAIPSTTSITTTGNVGTNGTRTLNRIKNQVWIYGDDKLILPRLAAAFTRAIQLCGGKAEPF